MGAGGAGLRLWNVVMNMPVSPPHPLPYRVLKLEAERRMVALAVHESGKVCRLVHLPWARCPTEVLRRAELRR